ncbi:MAG: response regulator [Candidatus Margulisiibacteriota bacterium]|jgi:DNA-binding NtrC family response regulator
MSNLPKLLIIDDEPSVCETLKIAFSDLFNVTYFTNLDTARNFIKETKDIKFLILDFIINRESGIDFYKYEIHGNMNLPTVLISGFIGQVNTTKEETRELEKLFIKLVEKPFDIIELRNFFESKLADT